MIKQEQVIEFLGLKQDSEGGYTGKEKPSITLFEFFKIEHGLESNPIQSKKNYFS